MSTVHSSLASRLHSPSPTTHLETVFAHHPIAALIISNLQSGHVNYGTEGVGALRLVSKGIKLLVNIHISSLRFRLVPPQQPADNGGNQDDDQDDNAVRDPVANNNNIRTDTTCPVFSEQLKRFIQSFPNLVKLNLGDNDFGSAPLAIGKALSRTPSSKNLTFVRLYNCQLNTNAITELLRGDWEGLRYLNLGLNNFASDPAMAMEALINAKMPALEVLVLTGNNFQKDPNGALESLAKGRWPLLSRLYLGFCHLTAPAIITLLRSAAHWENLGELFLSGRVIKWEDNDLKDLVLACRKWPALERLDLYGTGLSKHQVELREMAAEEGVDIGMLVL